MTGDADEPCPGVVQCLRFEALDPGVRDVLILEELAERTEWRHRHRRRGDEIDVAVDVVAEHVELAAEAVAGGEDAVVFQIEAGFLVLADLGPQVRIGQEAEQSDGAVWTGEQCGPAAGRVRAGDQRFGDRGRPIAFSVTDIGGKTRHRRHADRDLWREPVAAGRYTGRVQVVAIVANRTDDLEPGRVIVLQLHEAAGDGPLAAWGRDVGVSAAVECLHIVLKRIEPIGQSVAPVADIETSRVVDVDPDRVEQIAAPVADAARDVVADVARTTKGGSAGRVVIGLDLIVVGPVAIQRRVPVEPHVVRSGVFPGDGPRVVFRIGRVNRRTLKQRALRGRQHGPAIELPDAVLIILKHGAELDLMTLGGPHRDLHQAGRDFIAGISDLGAGAILVIALGTVDGAAKHIDGRIGAHAAEDRAKPAILVGAVRTAHIDAPALAGTNDVVDILGAERDHAADRAGAVDVGRRAAHDIDTPDQLRIEEE